MANLSLRHIYKVYPNGTKAVSDFNMEIKDKEFIVFVGPSGCGKSTTLRMIAGLEDISAGELYIGNELMNDVEPKDRDIAMVFQNYALYPHMTVYDNMAFGLKLRHVSREEIHKKVLWAADVLKITEYLDRKPRAMSGGQRQRVALGRAILRNPKVFLLDEPLSNLDAKLRTEMRAEIAKLHQQLETTFIYVTHDQTEAMTLGTRVVVMKLGRIQQIDTPQNLYDYPENKFVAGFIGTPQMNFFEATMKREGNDVKVKFDYCDNELVVPFNDLLKVRPKYLNGKEHLWVGLRCENISINENDVKNSHNLMKVKVSHFEELGNETLVYGDLNMKGDGFVESSTRVIIKSYHGAQKLKAGDVINACFDMKKAHFFDQTSELTIVPRIPKENVFDCSIKNNTISLLNKTIKLPPAIRCSNGDNYELFIPTDAINFNGDIEATVLNTEVINDTKVCYLKIAERVFFAIVNKDYKDGSTVKIGFDFKKISIRANNKEVITPLSEFDAYLGSFTNIENNKKSIQSILALSKDLLNKRLVDLEDKESIELAKFGFTDSLLLAYKKDYEEELEKNKEDRSYKLGEGKLDKEGKKKVQLEFKEANIKAKKNYDTKVSEVSKNKNLVLSKENEEKANEIKSLYKNERTHLEDVFANYKQTLENGFKDIEKESKKITLSLKNDYKTKHDALVSDYKKNVEQIEKDTPITKPEDKNILKEKLSKAKNLFMKAEDQIGLESKLFYTSINGEYVPSTLNINKKIIQALGVAVFRSNYRYELNHYAYRLVERNGFMAKVLDNLDYGNEIFAKCEVFDQIIYVNVPKALEVGKIVRLSYDVSQIEIYENKFDIRLY